MKELYAIIVKRLLSRGIAEEKVVGNLVKHLKERGRMKLLPGILDELKVLKAREKTTGAVLEIARAEDKLKALAGATEAGIEVKEIVTNPDLIRGWRLRSGGTLIDRSGKRALIDLYEKIVNA